jgi:hypothetical protein
MSSATASAFSAVFPILLLAIVLEGRHMHPKLRQLPFLRWVSITAIAIGLVGLVTSLVATQVQLLPAAVVLLWVFMGGMTIATGIVLIALLATSEIEADGADQ